MSNLRQAAQQALKASDALEKVRGPFDEKGVATVPFFYLREFGAAMEELRQALAEPRPIQECYGDCPTNPQTCPNPCNFEGRPKPEQEPVACIGTNGELMWLNKPTVIYSKPIPLYTAPTPRKPLSEKEMYAVEEEARKNFRLSQRGPRGQQITYWDVLTPWLIRAVERAHGIGEQT